MNKELEAFNFISSHDLLEPLRKIQTFSSRIIEIETLSEKGHAYFKRIQAAAARMRNLIEDLLIFSRTRDSERKFVKVDLNILLDEVKNEINDVLVQNHVTIESGQLCELEIIPFQFRQLLSNLITNSVKFARENVNPIITVRSKKLLFTQQRYSQEEVTVYPPEIMSTGKDYCRISISDNGIGFEPEFNERIFELFQRLHGKSEYPGLELA